MRFKVGDIVIYHGRLRQQGMDTWLTSGSWYVIKETVYDNGCRLHGQGNMWFNNSAFKVVNPNSISKLQRLLFLSK